MPFYIVGQDGKKGMLRRQCTNHYKIKPIYRHVRTLAGGIRARPFPKGKYVEMWLGISLDEATRMKASREKWVEHRWPLIDLGMTRQDCIDWFGDHYPGRSLPRSACVICPYRSIDHWAELKESEPLSFEEAIRFDRWLRHSKKNPVRQILDGIPYLHVSRRPLESVVSEFEAESHCNTTPFEEECEGLCGV